MTSPFRLLLFALGSLMLFAHAAQAQFEIKGGAFNRLSKRVPASNTTNIPPIGTADSPTGDPTITPQYSNVVETSASSGPIDSVSGYPSSISPGIKLTRSSVGSTFASGVPRYFLGDLITPPLAIKSQAGGDLNTSAVGFWRAEPVRAAEVLSNPSGAIPLDYRTGESSSVPALVAPLLETFYYSPHAKAVFASTPGNVEITWRSSVPDPATNNYIYYKERFAVSSATTTPVRTMYWTERGFNAPRINIPAGQIKAVNPVYSNAFPASVSTEIQVEGVTRTAPDVTTTVWYVASDNGVTELHAYNLTGRLLIEYLGADNGDGTHQFLGMDIISVAQSLTPTTVSVELGNEIRPYHGEGIDPDESLLASPLPSNTSNETSYYGSSTRPDGSLAYYAEKENDIEDHVRFYWLEPRGIAIPPAGATAAVNVQLNWPRHLNKYLQVWPTDATHFAHYTVGANGSSVTSGTGLKFEGGNIPQIIYQDATEGGASLDAGSQRLVVNFNGETDQLNRTLLKFTGSNGGIQGLRMS